MLQIHPIKRLTAAPPKPPTAAKPAYVVPARPATPALCRVVKRVPATTFPTDACYADATVPATIPPAPNPSAGRAKRGAAASAVPPTTTLATVFHISCLARAVQLKRLATARTWVTFGRSDLRTGTSRALCRRMPD